MNPPHDRHYTERFNIFNNLEQRIPPSFIRAHPFIPLLLLLSFFIHHLFIIMPSLPWLLFKGAFKMTAKGAAVTLSSTVASCTLACYIEIGAHRIVYHYFPHRYANVEHANGLTQEQLDAVRIYNTTAGEPIMTTSAVVLQEREEQASDSEKTEEYYDLSAVYKPPTDKELAEVRPLSSTTNMFWKDDEKQQQETNTTSTSSIPRRPSFTFPSNDILACAMTG